MIGLNQFEFWITTSALKHLSDAELLTKFLGERGKLRSEMAFNHLVGRHGPMVLGVCRRITRNENYAADAFQATFLILLRKAACIQVNGSLGPWLHGVAIRIARRARAVAVRDNQRFFPLGDMDPAIQSRRQEPDVRISIDEELARLPPRFRNVLILCDLQGLTRKEAAFQLGCPVGTVESRLYRARAQLRCRLIRRGLSPSITVGFVILGTEASQAKVPLDLAVITTKLAASFESLLPGVVPVPAVTDLIHSFSWSMLMKKLSLATLIATAASLCITVAALSKGAAETPQSEQLNNLSPPKLADQFSALRKEFEAEWQKATEETKKATKPSDHSAIWSKYAPEHGEYCRRAVDIARRQPEDPVAREMLLWAIDRPYAFVQGPFADEYARAVSLLVRHHASHVDVARFGLGLDNLTAPARETLLLAAYSEAKDHEAKGLSRLALACYLQRSLEKVEMSRRSDLGTKGRMQLIDDEGKPYVKEFEVSSEIKTDYARMRIQDPAFIQKEAERLFREVIADYGDVAYLTRHHLQVEALAKVAEPKWLGKSLNREEVKQYTAALPKPRTLADVAKDRLEQLNNLRAGQKAPAIEAPGLDGKPIKLADYQGRVIVLVFWGTWCGPCMREVPHERELAERYKDRPFTLLGINCRDTVDKAKAAVADHRLNWPQWLDGEDGPIQKAYHVERFPTVFVIDHLGVIRVINVLGKTLDEVLEPLVKEAEKAKEK